MHRSTRLSHCALLLALASPFALGCAGTEFVQTPGPDGAETGSSESSVSAGTVLLAPASDVGSWNVVGVGDTANLYKNVDDGTTFASADGDATAIATTAGIASGSHRVGYAGAPSGVVTSVSVSYRASRGTAHGTAQVELYDGTTLIGTGNANALGAWANFTDTFAGLTVPDANNLRTRVVLKNTDGVGSVRYTQVFVAATFADQLANPRRFSGTWALQQVSSVAELNSQLKGALGTALATPGIRGFSMRVPWKSIATDFSLLEAGLKAAQDRGLAFTIRFMAGRHTPATVFTAGSPYYSVNGEKVPTPFKPDGSPNTIFEAAYDDFVGQLADWCGAHDVHLLHLAWYGQDWAELNHGSEVRAQPGYTYARWLTAHERLLDLGIAYATDTLTVEAPFSGHGPLTTAANDLASYVIGEIGPSNPRFFCQSNGWGPTGDWGAPDAQTEAAFDQVWTKKIFRGEQAIQGNDYDWAPLYDMLYANHATYTEVYASSFTLQHKAQLASEIDAFADAVEAQLPVP